MKKFLMLFVQEHVVTYLNKHRRQNLIEAIKEVHDGGSPMSSNIARKVIKHFQDQSNGYNGKDYNLTSREKEVLKCE
jgi:DNA-binding NarL/FixJ family response regulator